MAGFKLNVPRAKLLNTSISKYVETKAEILTCSPNIFSVSRKQ